MIWKDVGMWHIEHINYLYHGTDARFNNISLDKAKAFKDFGKGFYLTSIPEQAVEWARSRGDQHRNDQVDAPKSARSKVGEEGGFFMILTLRNDSGKLKAKDILDLNMDMSVVQKKGKYYVKINRTYVLDQEYDTEDEAEGALASLVQTRNDLENELRLYS